MQRNLWIKTDGLGGGRGEAEGGIPQGGHLASLEGFIQVSSFLIRRNEKTSQEASLVEGLFAESTIQCLARLSEVYLLTIGFCLYRCISLHEDRWGRWKRRPKKAEQLAHIPWLVKGGADPGRLVSWHPPLAGGKKGVQPSSFLAKEGRVLAHPIKGWGRQ